MDQTVHRRPGYAFALARSSDADQQVRVHERREPDAVVPGRRRPLPLPRRARTRRRPSASTTSRPSRRTGWPASPRRSRRAGRSPSCTARRGTTTRTRRLHLVLRVAEHLRLLPARHQRATPAAPRSARTARPAWCSPTTSPYAANAGGCCPTTSWPTATPTATKSWFMFDDEIVVLAAGVGDPAGRAVTTTLDSRIAAASDAVTAHRRRSRDGRAGPATGTGAAGWLRYANAHAGHRRRLRLPRHRHAPGHGRAGDGHPQPPRRPHVQPGHRRSPSRSSPLRRAAGRRAARARLRAGPGRHRGSLTAYRGRGRCGARQQPRAQAVEHPGLGLLAANTFARARTAPGGLPLDGPASVILARGRRRHRRRSPWRTRRRNATRSPSPSAAGRCARGRADEGVRVSRVPGGTRIDVDHPPRVRPEPDRDAAVAGPRPWRSCGGSPVSRNGAPRPASLEGEAHVGGGVMKEAFLWLALVGFVALLATVTFAGRSGRRRGDGGSHGGGSSGDSGYPDGGGGGRRRWWWRRRRRRRRRGRRLLSPWERVRQFLDAHNLRLGGESR